MWESYVRIYTKTCSIRFLSPLSLTWLHLSANMNSINFATTSTWLKNIKNSILWPPMRMPKEKFWAEWIMTFNSTNLWMNESESQRRWRCEKLYSTGTTYGYSNLLMQIGAAVLMCSIRLISWRNWSWSTPLELILSSSKPLLQLTIFMARQEAHHRCHRPVYLRVWIRLH